MDEICRSAPGFTSVLNGRFTGGWTTRRYGRPKRGIHAIQMAMAQSTYMLERSPWTWSDAKELKTRAHLSSILIAFQQLIQNGDLQ